MYNSTLWFYHACMYKVFIHTCSLLSDHDVYKIWDKQKFFFITNHHFFFVRNKIWKKNGEIWKHLKHTNYFVCIKKNRKSGKNEKRIWRGTILAEFFERKIVSQIEKYIVVIKYCWMKLLGHLFWSLFHV